MHIDKEKHPHWLDKCGSLILSSIQVIFMRKIAKEEHPLNWKLCIGNYTIDPSQWLEECRQGGTPLELEIVDRWFCHRSKSLTRGDSQKIINPWVENVDRRFCQRSKSGTCGMSQRRNTPWVENCESVILSTIQVSDLRQLAMEEHPLGKKLHPLD